MIERRKQEGWAWKKRAARCAPGAAGQTGQRAEANAAWARAFVWRGRRCIPGRNPAFAESAGQARCFFSGCALHCVFCQNAEISQRGFGKEIGTAQLAEIFLRLQDEGAQTLDLVSPTHFAPQIARALERAKPRLPGVRLKYQHAHFTALAFQRRLR